MGKTLKAKLLERKLKTNEEKKKSVKTNDELNVVTSLCNGVTEATFEDLQDVVVPPLLKALQEMGFTNLTEVQRKVYDLLLRTDKLYSLKVLAKTGSGKTMAYLLPLVNLVNSIYAKDSTGTVAFVLCPTRELASQTYGVLCQLLKYCPQKAALVKGGGVKKDEASALYWGASIVVGTPGRLLDHLKTTEGFVFHNFCTLVIDEADRLFDLGFAKEMKQIVAILRGISSTRQSLLFSATDSEKVSELSRVFDGPSRVVDVRDAGATQATVTQLDQEVLFVKSEERLFSLYCLLSNMTQQKVMVFVNSWLSADLHNRLLVNLGISCLHIHGRMTQEQRQSGFNKFNRASAGVLICTDIAARGWDVSQVNVIVQYDPPDDPSDYIHRVGRTARVGRRGKAIVFLREEEFQFVHFMRAHGVTIKHVHSLNTEGMTKQRKTYDWLQKVVEGFEFGQKLAAAACAKYLRMYRSQRLKYIYDAATLQPDAVARGFMLKDASALEDLTEDDELHEQMLSFLRGKAAKSLSNKLKHKVSYKAKDRRSTKSKTKNNKENVVK